MPQKEQKGAPSRAAIGGHPIHPMLVVFPIAFLVGAFFSDLAYWATQDPFWARGSLWLIGTGFVMGLLAAALGLIDFFSIPRARAHAEGWVHFLGNAVVLLLALVNLLLRLEDAAMAVLPWGLLLSAATALLLAVTGWYGGELAYRHMIGVIGPRKPPD